MPGCGVGLVKALRGLVTCFVGVLRGGGFYLLPKDLEKTRVFSKSYARLPWSILGRFAGIGRVVLSVEGENGA